ncbi:MAG: zinc ribbon domain-containing protein [Asgard group archaeon]|nr:zinc ribbon domain-containing protein [Asgard group archaeon]
MSKEKHTFCVICGAEISNQKFCPKCGTKVGATELDEINDQLKRLNEIKENIETLRSQTINKLSLDSEKLLVNLREIFAVIYKRTTLKKDYLEAKDAGEINLEETIPQGKTRCNVCGKIVPNVRFCNECGILLHCSRVTELDDFITKLQNISSIFINFKASSQDVFDSNDIERVELLSVSIQQLLSRISARRNAIVKAEKIPVQTQPTPVTVLQTPYTTDSSTAVIQEMPSEPKRWSGFERNLLNYWFFYLAIILFSIGVTITIYFVVVEISSTRNQLIVINSIGLGIVLIGEIISILSRRAKKKRLANLEIKEKLQDEDSTTDLLSNLVEQTEKGPPIPEIASVIIFIGFIVLYVGGILGMAGYESLGVSKAIFVYLSLGLCLITIVIGILNNSEMITLEGLSASIIIISIDFLWTAYPTVLGNIGGLFAFMIPIILATLIAIFFEKWWGTVLTMSLTPIFLCVPLINSQITLEILPIMLVPVMILLSIRFCKKEIPISFKRSLVFLSLVIPTISLIVMSIPILGPGPVWYLLSEPYILAIGGMSVLVTSFAYIFIQEKHLEFKPDLFVIPFIGQLLYGFISIFTLAFRFNTVASLIFFISFFIIGVISLLKVFKNYFSIAIPITSFVIAEIQAILLLTLIDPNNMAESACFFIIGILFGVLATVSLFISKVFIESQAVFSVWAIISAINVSILGPISKISGWFTLIALIVVLLTLLVVNLPIVTKIAKWRWFAIPAVFGCALVLIVFVSTGTMAFFPYSELVIFLTFVLINIPVFLHWQKMEAKING